VLYCIRSSGDMLAMGLMLVMLTSGTRGRCARRDHVHGRDAQRRHPIRV